MTLEQLKQEELELREKLSANLTAQKKIKTDAFTAQYGVSLGDRITAVDGRKTIEGVIHKMEAEALDKSVWMIRIYVIKQDGTVGMRSVSLYPSSFNSIKLVEKAK